jgi:hypothetical protein
MTRRTANVLADRSVQKRETRAPAALFPDLGPWLPARDGCAAGRALYHRHYSCRAYRDGRAPKKFVGPGEYLVLLTPDECALFVWRKFRSLDVRFGAGINCSIFRNEGAQRSSDLIRAADEWAWKRWPEVARHYTYVNAHKTRSSNPGYCFQCAGWRRCGWTLGGLLVLEVTHEPA